MVIPAIQVTFYAGAIGGNMKDVRLLYTNNDQCKQHVLPYIILQLASFVKSSKGENFRGFTKTTKGCDMIYLYY